MFLTKLGSFAMIGLGAMLGEAKAASETKGARAVRLVALGDSLTAGYGLPADAALPVQLEKLLTARGHNVVIANAGVSGDTATDGLERLDWSVGDDAEGVIVALGANDALRGIDPAVTRHALDTILSRLAARRLPVLLVGMYAPRNLGADYVQAFDRVYPELAAKFGTPLYPFLLDGVVGNPRLNLGDGVHPTAAGVAIIAEKLTPFVEQLITTITAKQG